MNKSESIANLAAALVKAQAELSNPKKNRINPFFKSPYADLSEVINCSKSILAGHGLSVVQLLSFNELANVETILLHSTGEWISKTLAMPVPKHDAQTIGAIFTYSRRYALAAILSLAQEDTDGNAETAKPTAAVTQKPKIDYAATLNAATDLADLAVKWRGVPKNLRPGLESLKNDLKQSLTDVPNFPEASK